MNLIDCKIVQGINKTKFSKAQQAKAILQLQQQKETALLYQSRYLVEQNV
jgi:hypothetical protein